MRRLAFHKEIAQPQLVGELVAAGVPYTWEEGGALRLLVVQTTESVTAGVGGEIHPTGDPPLVEVVFSGDVADSLVEAVVAAHVPDAPVAPVPGQTPLQQLAAVVVGALDTVPDNATPAQMRDAVKTAIAEAAGL